LNILIVATDFPPDRGGISTYSKELAIALSKICNVTVLATGASKIAETDKNISLKIIRTPSIPFLRIAALLFYFPLVIKRYHIGSVLHTVWLTALISHMWHWLMPVPYFVSIHASEILDDRRTWRRRIKSYLKGWRIAALNKAKAIFPVSHYGIKLATAMGIAKERIFVISNGVTPTQFQPSPSPSAMNGKKKLLTVARLDLHKGHDHVLEALAILKNQGFMPEYTIAGEGEEKMRLRMITKRLGLTHQVKFVGYIPDNLLPSTYAGADIYVMPSREIPGRLDLIEGFGISFLEASASGLPVIAGRSGGVSDAVRDGITGILVNPDDPRDIARAILLLLSDNDLALKLGNEGRKWIETQMNWDCVAERMHSAVRKLI